MPSWMLPGRTNSRILRYKVILEKSFAFSRTCNQRNLEYHWYPLWNQTLIDLVSTFPNLIVAPQYPIWFVPQHDEEIEDDEDEDGNDPEEIVLNIGRSCPSASTMVDGDDDDQELADVSFASTMPERHAKSVLVDFAIINLSAVPMNQPKRKVRYGGWRITQGNVGILVEIKRFVSRSLTGAEMDKELEIRISEAHEDLVNQAAHLFVQDKAKDSVVVIAAAGLYWCSTKIHRRDVKEIMQGSLEESDPTFQGHTDVRAKVVDLKWSSLVRLDLARSHDRLYTIYKGLEASGVLEAPEHV